MNSKRFLIVLTVALAIISGLLIRSVFYYQGQAADEKEELITGQKTSGEDTYLFNNDEYGYSVIHPLHLAPRKIDVEDSSYLSFVKFEPIEEGFTDAFSIGVRETDLDEEIKLITDEMTSGSVDAEIVSQQPLSQNDLGIYRMDFEPKDDKSGEERSILLVNNGKYTYSISSKPDHLLEAFSRLNLQE